MSKILIYIIAAFIVIGLIGDLLFYFGISKFSYITTIVHSIGGLGGLILLLKHGTILKSKFLLPIMLGFLAFIFIGSLMKIMHWPYGHLILLTCFIGIPVTYSLHFFKKQGKHYLDILKLVWVVVSCTTAIFIIGHYPFKQEMRT